MHKEVLKAVLRILAGTVLILALAATVGIPAGRRGPAAQSDDESGSSGACARDGHYVLRKVWDWGLPPELA
jgi:hypothetical protein